MRGLDVTAYNPRAKITANRPSVNNPHPPVDPSINNEQRKDQADIDEGYYCFFVCSLPVLMVVMIAGIAGQVSHPGVAPGFSRFLAAAI